MMSIFAAIGFSLHFQKSFLVQLFKKMKQQGLLLYKNKRADV